MRPLEPSEAIEADDGVSRSSANEAFPTRRSMRPPSRKSARRSARRASVPPVPEPSVTVSAAVPPAAAGRPAVRTGRGSRRRTLATMLVVPALVGTVALPAYASLPDGVDFAASDRFSLTRAEAQDVEVSSLVAEVAVSRDGYAVVTAAEIQAATEEAQRAEREQASREALSEGNYPTRAVQAEGDDYPYWYETPDDFGGGLSPFGYYYRECVDFVAWRMNRDAGVHGAPWLWTWHNLASGSAWAWADAWYSRGWPVSNEPVVGAVAWFNYNHVAYVQSINEDGSVNIEEYNQNSDHSYHQRTIGVGEAIYLYPPG